MWRKLFSRSEVKLAPPMYFSYSQFLVYDASVAAPGCDWTKRHVHQGFARRDSTVSFSTLLESGHAEITWRLGPYVPDREHARVVAVPFVVVTGKVLVEGVEERSGSRQVVLEPGQYRLTAAQAALNDDEERVVLSFEKLDRTIDRSVVLVADGELKPEIPLLETAEEA